MRLKKFKSLLEKQYDGPDPSDLPPKKDDKKDKKANTEPKYEEEEEEEHVPNRSTKKTGNLPVSDPVDDFFNRDEEEFNKSTIGGEEEEEEEDEEEDDKKEWTEEDEANFEGKEDMEHLTYLIRAMFTNAKIEDFFISTEGWDITIVVEMSKKDRLERLVKSFELAKNIKKELLPQYDDKFEEWESKGGDPLLVFEFELDTGNKKSNEIVHGSEDYIQSKLFPEEYHADKKKNKRGGRGGKSDGNQIGPNKRGNANFGYGSTGYDDDDYDESNYGVFL